MSPETAVLTVQMVRDMSHFETTVPEIEARNKKEVKTGTFSPPGVGGVLHDIYPLAAQQACPARQDCGLTRALLLAIR